MKVCLIAAAPPSGESSPCLCRSEVDFRMYKCLFIDFWMILQVKTRVAGRAHTLTVRDVKLSEAGEVRLSAKDFQTSAQLIIRGETSKRK